VRCFDGCVGWDSDGLGWGVLDWGVLAGEFGLWSLRLGEVGGLAIFKSYSYNV